MSAATRTLDLSAPPVVKTIGQRSLVIGLMFVGGAPRSARGVQPDDSSAVICWAIMVWLGVTLGSMAILMLRHLTRGAWGMVIRRITGRGHALPFTDGGFIYTDRLFGMQRPLHLGGRWTRCRISIARAFAGHHPKLSESSTVSGSARPCISRSGT